MNTAEFGATIKQKYPQYKDLPDEEIGNKMLQKYPQYQDMITVAPVVKQEPKQTNKVLDFLIPETVKYGKTLLDTPKMISKWSEELKKNGPFAAPSPELREISGGSRTDTGNRYLNSALDAFKKTREATGAGAEVGSLVSGVKSVISGFKNILHPLKNAGSKLESVRSTINVPKAESETKILENITKDRKYILNPELRKEVDTGFQKLIKGTNPGEEVSNLNEIYKNLNSITGLGDDAQGILNKAVRDYARPLQTNAGVRLEKTYSNLKKLEPYMKKMGYGMAGATGAGIVWSFRSKLAKLFGLSD